MSCVIGYYFTITLSNDGVVHSFGLNEEGQIGQGNIKGVSLPRAIPNLPKISQVSCGGHFTVCVDFEGFLWTFGQNNAGQLGTGNTTSFNIPQKITNIPPVFSVSCGNEHTLIITNNDDLWSCGVNSYGQLCLGNKEHQLTFQQTSFSNIVKISSGGYHSLFQNNEGIYACGFNSSGELGLGNTNPQITPTLIPNLPPNIVHFVCGYDFNLFLDSEGNVFSVGFNGHGQLGLGHDKNQNILNQILDIPPIQTISCVSSSSFLIDLEGNVWSFGNNIHGQLGHGDQKIRNVPTKIECLKHIKQICYGPGCCGYSNFLAKDLHNKIFVVGFNDFGTGNTQSISTPQEIPSQYFPIWGDILQTRAKSARK